MASSSSVPLKRHLSSASDNDQAQRANPRSLLPTPPPSSPSVQPNDAPKEVVETARCEYVLSAQMAHPDIIPQNDFELLVLGGDRLAHCSNAVEKRAWISAQWASLVARLGSEEVALQGVRKILDRVLEVTGRKPRPDDPEILLFPLDGSDYTMRLWPGSAVRAEYCLDFIETKTEKLVNVPDDFKLWFVPAPSAPWLQGTGPVELLTLERSVGLSRGDYPEGEEKIVVRDGMTCVLCRPGAKDAIFTVPLRQAPRMAYYSHMDQLQPRRAH